MNQDKSYSLAQSLNDYISAEVRQGAGEGAQRQREECPFELLSASPGVRSQDFRCGFLTRSSIQPLGHSEDLLFSFSISSDGGGQEGVCP